MTLRIRISFSVFIGVGLLIPSVVFLLADVQKFVFVSATQVIAIGAISEQITLQSQDAAGTEFKVPSTACVSLSVAPSGGEFSSSATTWSSVSILTMAKNSANRNFYFKDTVAGVHTITAKVVLKPDTESRSCASWPVGEWPSGWTATQSITIGSGTTPPPVSSQSSGVSGATVSTSTEEEIVSPPPSSVPANSGGTTWVYKPQIYVSALVPLKGVAGAPVLFDAVAVGLKKEPLPNAKYLWSFGDGGTAEGKKLSHTYHYPATYTVLVDASSGEWSAMDRKEIMILDPELVISNIKEGGDGFIEIQNEGKNEIDLSLWLLKTSSGLFTIPQGTVIGARKVIPFPAAITHLLADAGNIALLYPNGNFVVAYVEKQNTLEPAPVRRQESQVILMSTPKEVEPKKSVSVPPSKPAEKESIAPAMYVPPVASSTELIGAVGAVDGRGMMPWLGGVGVLLVVAVGGYLLMLRPKPEQSPADILRREAAKFDIIE